MSIKVKKKWISTDMTDDLELEEAIDPIREVFTVQKDPTGFENQTDSIIAFDTGTRTFSIAPASTSFNVWHRGVKTTISTTLTKQIPDTSGPYYLYIDSSGTLEYDTVFSTAFLDQYAFISYIYWNATDGKLISFGEERHGLAMSYATHEYLHLTRGTQLLSGASVSFTTNGSGNSNADAQISLSDMRVADEDITANITNSATPTQRFEQTLFPTAFLPVYYKLGTIWTKDTATAYPVKTGTNYAYFNKDTSGTWSLQEASGDGKYVVSYIFATTNIQEPIIALMGQDEYDSLSDAQERAGWNKVDFGGLPTQEFKLLYIVYFETSSLYSNAAKSAVRYVGDFRFGIDREVSAIPLVTDHGNLTGLGDNDHPQYALAATFTETAQDAIGQALTDTSSVNFTYDDLDNQIRADVLPAGVDHNALANYEANRHIDHSAVQVNAGTGLTGGGDITATRTISMPNVGTAGSFGATDRALSITTDAQGRVSSATASLISIVSTQVSNFAATVLSTVLSGLSLASTADVSAADSVISAFGKIQAIFNQIRASEAPLSTGTTNSAGTSTALARADHIHATELNSDTTGSTTSTNTTSTTDVSLLSLTPPAGSYFVKFSTTVTNGSNNATVTASIYAGGTQNSNSERSIVPRASNTQFTILLETHAIVTVNGAQAIETRWRTSGGTATSNRRSMDIIRIGS